VQRESGATNDRCFVYLPQSFIGIVWHQQLLEAEAAAVGVAAGAGAGEIRESTNAKRVSMGVNVPFFLR
jgi:hypothetical protein